MHAFNTNCHVQIHLVRVRLIIKKNCKRDSVVSAPFTVRHVQHSNRMLGKALLIGETRGNSAFFHIHASHKKDQHKLAKIGKIAKRMGVNSKNLNELYQNDCINMVDKILKDAHHPLYNCYVFLRSGRRLNVHMQRTSRLRNTFVPSSINLCNRKLKK